MSKPCDNCGSDLKVCKDCDLYTGKYFKAELEEIKTEIQEFLATEGFPYEDYKGITLLLEKHIKELKNECINDN